MAQKWQKTNGVHSAIMAALEDLGRFLVYAGVLIKHH